MIWIGTVNVRFLLAGVLVLLPLWSPASSDTDKLTETAAQSDRAPEIERVFQRVRNGDAEAQHLLGSMYLYGQGVEQNNELSTRWFRSAAAQGHVAAQGALGLAYYKGTGVPVDNKEAAKWIQKAASQGDASSQYNLAILYGRGDGVAQDHAEASRWYHEAAQQGHADAQVILGNRYRHGIGVPHDYSQALEWYLKAANQEHPDALLAAGSMHMQGTGVRRNVPKGLELIRRAAMKGHSHAQYILALSFESDEIGGPKDMTMACAWMLVASGNGSAEAQDELRRYKALIGVAQMERAEAAAEQIQTQISQ